MGERVHHAGDVRAGIPAVLGSPGRLFLTIGRIVLEPPRAQLWWPYWNGGMAFQNTYFPLVPAVTALLAEVAAWSPARALHVFSAAAYCLGPVTLFVLGWRMSGLMGASFWAAMAYSLYSTSNVF